MMPLAYRVPVTVTYPLDPLGPKIGGSASFIRGFIEHAPAHFDLRFVGVTSDVAQRAPGDWRRECLGGREFEFLPLFHEANEDIRRRIPLALRFVAALARTPPGPDGAVLVHNRLETLCARGARAHRNVVIIHNDVHAQIGSGPGEVLWSRFPGLYYRFEQHVFGFADQVYTVSTATLADYRKRYAATAGKFAFVPTYVDTARFRLPEHMHQQRRDRPAVRGLPRSPGAPWILYVGRLQPQKAPVRLIGSFALLRQKWPEAQLIVLGDGNLRGVVEQMVRDLALTGHVHLLGAVEQAELPAFYQAADLLLLASDFEGMPMCVLEALACGLPVASTRVGEVERVVLSGATGEIAADFSEQALVTAMLEVLDHPANYASRRCAEAVAPYSPARVLAPLYARIDELGRPRPTSAASGVA